MSLQKKQPKQKGLAARVVDEVKALMAGSSDAALGKGAKVVPMPKKERVISTMHAGGGIFVDLVEPEKPKTDAAPAPDALKPNVATMIDFALSKPWVITDRRDKQATDPVEVKLSDVFSSHDLAEAFGDKWKALDNVERERIYDAFLQKFGDEVVTRDRRRVPKDAIIAIKSAVNPTDNTEQENTAVTKKNTKKSTTKKDAKGATKQVVLKTPLGTFKGPKPEKPAKKVAASKKEATKSATKKTAAKKDSEKTSTRPIGHIFDGVSVTKALVWMGRDGFSSYDAINLLKKYKLTSVNLKTVRTNLARGKNPKYAESEQFCPKLSREQAKELRAFKGLAAKEA